MVQIRISPDFKLVADRLSALKEGLPARIYAVAPEAATVMETAFKSEAPVRTGAGRDSINSSVTQTTAGRSARIVTTALPYMRYVKGGTVPHQITPRNGRMLAWLNDNGTLVFARSVMHPGQQANDFVSRGWEQAEPQIRQLLREAGLRGWRELSRFKG